MTNCIYRVWCCECYTDVESVPMTGDIIYPNREDLALLNFWMCPHCKNYVSSIKISYSGEGNKPAGSIPTVRLRKARQKIHQIIDPLWRKKLISRKRLYAEMSRRIGKEYHTARINTEAEAIVCFKLANEIKYRILKETLQGKRA